MTRVAIMQPTYLPWIGYFGLMHSVDIFILLDSVQFAKRSWQQRNQIKTSNGAKWLSVPVLSKGKRDQKINQVEIDQSSNFSRDHCQTIEYSYRKAVCFHQFSQSIFDIVSFPHKNLVDLNINLIDRIKYNLGITTQIVRSSEMNGKGAKAELLLSLCKEAGATEYVSPPGSKGYLEETDIFKDSGVPVRYFNFLHPVYPQLYKDFLPYMSCVDLLFNCGDKSLDLISEGCEIL